MSILKLAPCTTRLPMCQIGVSPRPLACVEASHDGARSRSKGWMLRSHAADVARILRRQRAPALLSAVVDMSHAVGRLATLTGMVWFDSVKPDRHACRYAWRTPPTVTALTNQALTDLASASPHSSTVPAHGICRAASPEPCAAGLLSGAIRMKRATPWQLPANITLEQTAAVDVVAYRVRSQVDPARAAGQDDACAGCPAAGCDRRLRDTPTDVARPHTWPHVHRRCHTPTGDVATPPQTYASTVVKQATRVDVTASMMHVRFPDRRRLLQCVGACCSASASKIDKHRQWAAP